MDLHVGERAGADCIVRINQIDIDQELLALWGPSVKPGDRAMITKFDIHGDRIHFEINGGPVRKSKWYQHIQVGMNGGMASPGGGQTDPINNPRGSYVDLVFDHHIPDLTAEQLKQMLQQVVSKLEPRPRPRP